MVKNYVLHEVNLVRFQSAVNRVPMYCLVIRQSIFVKKGNMFKLIVLDFCFYERSTEHIIDRERFASQVYD